MGIVLAGLGVATLPSVANATPPSHARSVQEIKRNAVPASRTKRDASRPSHVERDASRPSHVKVSASSAPHAVSTKPRSVHAASTGKVKRPAHAAAVPKRSERESKAERERVARVQRLAHSAFDVSGSTVAIHNKLVFRVVRANLIRLQRLHRVRVRKAINFAMAQLGKPYVFNANGPNAWDCSGLTAAAYKAAGIWMDDYSGSQFNAFPHVPLNQLEPGDLVFLGPGGTQHVAMYIGNGLQIAAPHTGTVVQIQPHKGHLTGAVRPG
jgi:cell wall-associated NlpC family hydrolase